MNATEIVDWVETDLRMMKLDPPGPADILAYANRMNVRVARDLRIPRRYIKDVSTGAAFAPPSEAIPESMSFVEVTNTNARITVLTVDEANAEYPDWETNLLEGSSRYPTRLIIYDPGNITAPIYPIGFESGELLRIEYCVVPRPMVFSNPTSAETTVPFEGLIPDYHRIIPQLTTFNLGLLKIPSDPNEAQVVRMKTQAIYADAQKDIEAAFSATHPSYYMPVTGIQLETYVGTDF